MSSHTLEGNLGGNPNETLQNILLSRCSQSNCMYSGEPWPTVSSFAFWCQLLAFALILSWSQQSLAEGTVADWEGFALFLHFPSLQRSLSPRDKGGPSPFSLLCSPPPEELRLNLFQIGMSSCISWALGWLLFCTTASLFNTVVQHSGRISPAEPQGNWRTLCLVHHGGLRSSLQE